MKRGLAALSADALGNGVLFLIAIAWAAASLDLRYGSLLSPGPAFLPRNLAILMAVISGWGLGRELLKKNEADRVDVARLLAGTGPKVAVTLVATAAFVVALKPLGYGIAMTGLMLGYLVVGGVTLRRSVLIALGGTIGTWLLFEGMLGLPLPGSLLDAIFPV